MGAMAPANCVDSKDSACRVGHHHRAANRLAANRGAVIGLEDGGVIVSFPDGRVQFVAQAKVQSEAGSYLPVVLRKGGIGVTQPVHGGLVGGADFGVIRQSQQKRGVSTR